MPSQLDRWIFFCRFPRTSWLWGSSGLIYQHIWLSSQTRLKGYIYIFVSYLSITLSGCLSSYYWQHYLTAYHFMAGPETPHLLNKLSFRLWNSWYFNCFGPATLGLAWVSPEPDLPLPSLDNARDIKPSLPLSTTIIEWYNVTLYHYFSLFLISHLTYEQCTH